ncbi:putative toxin-antitoxin system toxin component, PIN family [Geminocystis sp. CENA526]|uniref:putative toxin-antitoxin system toxin component, PIN family n=1 Tax=Geminocystis sp. CENA526 TaxID=1355871 RepID=UPI003D6FA4E7
MRKKPLVIVDTSVFISALRSSNLQSAPNLIIKYWLEYKFTLILTPQIEEEITLILIRHQIKETKIFNLLTAFDDLACYKEGIYQTNFLDKIDSKDNIFLSASYESKADYLVSLDKHLLNLKHFHQTIILNPQSFLNQLSQY